MIDEYYTWLIFGYHSYELKPQSNKRVVAVCDGCSKYRDVKKQAYADLCISCALVGREVSDKSRKKMSDKKIGISLSDSHRDALSKSKIGIKLPPFTEVHKKRISDSSMGKSFSEESRIRMSAAKQGISIDSWECFITSENDKFRTSAEYDIWRKSVFERDDYTCKECELRGVVLNAHHILPYSDWKEPRFSLNVKNGITLCEDCHRAIKGNEYEYFNKYFDIANGVGING